jgi:hypothetical protein
MRTAFKNTNITSTYGTGSFIVIHNSPHILNQLNLVPTSRSFPTTYSVTCVFIYLFIYCHSVEIPTRCSFVIEFIITKFLLRLNMFGAAHRSSSGALNCICSLWFVCPYGDRPLPRLSGNGRSPYGHLNQRLQIQFRAPDDERCAARNMLGL